MQKGRVDGAKSVACLRDPVGTALRLARRDLRLRIVSGLLDRSPYSRMTSDFPARNSELEQTTATVCEWRRTSAQVNIS